jgi:hypothetical protein
MRIPNAPRALSAGLGLVCLASVIAAFAQDPGSTSFARRNHKLHAAMLATPLNDGVGFKLICRGGPALRANSSGTHQAPASMNLPPWALIVTMTVNFNRSPLPPDHSGRNLQPGECSPEDIQLRDSDPTQIQETMNFDGQWQREMQGLPEDTSVDVAEKYPDSRNLSAYLQDPNHYWYFMVIDHGDSYLQSGYSRFWRPEFYQGPPPTSPTALAQPHHAQAIIDAATGTATETTDRNDAVDAAFGGNSAPVKVDPPICAFARSARARGSPAAASLEKQCREAGGTP